MASIPDFIYKYCLSTFKTVKVLNPLIIKDHLHECIRQSITLMAPIGTFKEIFMHDTQVLGLVFEDS